MAQKMIEAGAGTPPPKFYNANLLHSFTETASAAATHTYWINDLAFYAFILKEDVTIKSARVNISSGSGFSAFALYNSNDGEIGNKIFNSNQITNGTNVTNIYTPPTPILLKKGLYFGANHQSAGTFYRAVSGFTVHPAFGMLTSSANYNLYYKTQAYNSTLPNNAPSGGISAYIPSIAVILFEIE
jgi:hypothetical protein